MDLTFILNHAAGNLYWKDKEGRYLGANQAFIHLAGLKSIKEFIGKTDRDLFSKSMSNEKLTLLEETDQRILRTGIEENLREEGVDPQGKPAIYITKKIPIRDKKNNIIGIMGTSLDITKEFQADITRREFLANMRHDIRTPLAGIIGFAELLYNEAETEQTKRYTGYLLESCNALLELMDDILDIIHVTSGETPLLKKKFCLLAIVKHVIQLNQARALNKNIDLSYDYDSKIPQYLLGDNYRIHRIIMELIVNALKFTHQGFVRVNIVLAQKMEQKNIIKIIIEDSGVGIPKADQDNIYLQFKRLTNSYEEIIKGLDLGYLWLDNL